PRRALPERLVPGTAQNLLRQLALARGEPAQRVGVVVEGAYLVAAAARRPLGEKRVALVLGGVDQRDAAVSGRRAGGDEQRAERADAVGERAHVDQQLLRRPARRLF